MRLSLAAALPGPIPPPPPCFAWSPSPAKTRGRIMARQRVSPPTFAKPPFRPRYAGRRQAPCPAQPAPPWRSARRSAIEDDRLAAVREFMDQAAVRRYCPQVGIGRVQRARNGACPLALGLFAQVDERDVGAARRDLSPRPRSRPSRAAPPLPGAGPDACSPGRRRPSSSDSAGEGSPSAPHIHPRRGP